MLMHEKPCLISLLMAFLADLGLSSLHMPRSIRSTTLVEYCVSFHESAKSTFGSAQSVGCIIFLSVQSTVSIEYVNRQHRPDQTA